MTPSKNWKHIHGASLGFILALTIHTQHASAGGFHRYTGPGTLGVNRTWCGWLCGAPANPEEDPKRAAYERLRRGEQAAEQARAAPSNPHTTQTQHAARRIGPELPPDGDLSRVHRAALKLSRAREVHAANQQAHTGAEAAATDAAKQLSITTTQIGSAANQHNQAVGNLVQNPTRERFTNAANRAEGRAVEAATRAANPMTNYSEAERAVTRAADAMERSEAEIKYREQTFRERHQEVMAQHQAALDAHREAEAEHNAAVAADALDGAPWEVKRTRRQLERREQELGAAQQKMNEANALHQSLFPGQNPAAPHGSGK